VGEIVLGEEVHCETAINPIGNKTKTIGGPLYSVRRSSIEDHDVVPILAAAKVRSNDGAARFPKTKRLPKAVPHLISASSSTLCYSSKRVRVVWDCDEDYEISALKNRIAGSK